MFLYPSHNHPTIQVPARQGIDYRAQLRQLGVSKAALQTTDFHYLPHALHEGEVLGGVVYGFGEDGFVLLVATDRRIVFLDKKPLFVNEDDITYDVVSGVSVGSIGFLSTVTLHTRVKDYELKTFNKHSADLFSNFVQQRCIESNKRGDKL